ncbi:MAG: alpha/beta fold hydrolase [Limimaricola sp.]|uniref:alpha/beta fold hydrolase n=1 Tax=Limimaricola sp. TaxID=2211665 RepID=UPI001D6BA1F6|nr:alpha/beta fold hydrolase [Limimaricola sp.]MBI1415902.1 alpha/beta fold hydrolase [Limimaricola sp.]
MAEFVLVAGSCHGAWAWRDVVPALERRGHVARPLDLPAHGADTTPPGDVTLDSYAAAIVSAIDGRAVLVAHSAAGYPATLAARLAPEKIALIVYVCAYVPQPGLSVADLRRAAQRQPLRDAIVVDPRRVTYSFDTDLAIDRFYHDVVPTTARWAVGQLGPEPIGPQETPFGPLPEVPRAYVICSADRAIPPEAQREMTAGWPSHSVVTLPTSHSPFLADPDGLATALDGFATA